MIGLSIISYTIQLILCIFFLIQSIKTKDDKNWLTLFSINISAILNIILINQYLTLNKYLNNWDTLFGFTITIFLMVPIFCSLLIISFVFKLIDAKKNKKKITIKKLSKQVKTKAALLPFTIITLSTLLFCAIDYVSSSYEVRGVSAPYNLVKKKEIRKMTEFINNKYSINVTKDDCIHYQEQNYTEDSDFFGNSIIFNSPYIAVFKINNEEITVSDRKGFISDNRQLKDINNLLTNYYYEKTGIKFDYITFDNYMSGLPCGNDNHINKVLQTKFNKVITDKNIDQFLNYILQESEVRMNFYIKDDNSKERTILIDDIMKKLDYLKNNLNVYELNVIGYVGQLPVEYYKVNNYDNYDDNYKYGCYYVNNFSTREDILETFSLSLDAENSSSRSGEYINGWRYNNYSD